VKFSILIPAHDQRDTIGDAVASALAQDHPDFEVVVSDDASQDGTADRVAALPPDPRLRLHRGDRNVGRVANYRRCLGELARGDFVLMLDGDDFLTCRDYLTRAARAIDEHGAALVFGRIEFLDAATGARREPRMNRGLPPIQDGDDLFLRLADGDVALFHLSCVYDRRRAAALDFYRADILSSDFESLHRLILGARVGFVDAVAGVWRRHAASAISRTRPEQRIANLAAITGPLEAARATGRFPERALRRWLRRVLHQKASQDLADLLAQGDAASVRAYLDAVGRVSRSVAARLRLVAALRRVG
jgi:glycosyltransferase involved in cell wall biosynthesis